MSFHGELPTEERVSDSGSKYLVKVDPNKAKNKAAEQPSVLTSDAAKGEQKPAEPGQQQQPVKGK